MSVIRVSFKARGRVQGIGYRWFVQETAQNYSITGWVRNAYDGSVEGEAQGEKKFLDNFLSDIKQKHSWAVVRDIETKNIELINHEKNFSILQST